MGDGNLEMSLFMISAPQWQCIHSMGKFTSERTESSKGKLSNVFTEWKPSRFLPMMAGNGVSTMIIFAEARNCAWVCNPITSPIIFLFRVDWDYGKFSKRVDKNGRVFEWLAWEVLHSRK